MSESDDNMDVEIDSMATRSQPGLAVVEMAADRSQSQAAQEKPSEQVIDLENDKAKERREMVPRSEMWKHFAKIKDDKGNLVAAKCNYCSRQIKASTKGHGTSSLNKHFNICKRNPHGLAKDPTQGILAPVNGESPSIWRFDQNGFRDAFTEMVVECELPFAFGEKPGFRKFMTRICPRFQVPSRRTTTRDIVKCFFQEKAKLKKFFKDSCERVCLTTDGWTAKNQDCYMTVTASFIDENWNLHKKVIGLFKVKGHKGEDIGKSLVRVLNDWGLNRVMIVTVDNASANDSGVAFLRSKMQKTNIAMDKFMHVRCSAHIINLIVKDGLKEVDLSIKRVRAAIRYIKDGSSRLVKFKEIAEKEKVESKFLKTDVPTRWNHTYLMLKAGIAYEKVFMKLAEDDNNYMIDLFEERDGYGYPDQDDWNNAKKMAEFLEHFHDLTVRVSSSLHVTSNTFFHEIGEVHLLIQTWMNSGDTLQVEMGKRMKDKFDKYWGLWHTNSKDNEQDKDRSSGKKKEKEKENINLLIFVAAFLDPRYKLSLYTKISIEEIFGEERGQLVWAAINTCIRELFEEYKKLYAPNELATDATDPNQSKGGPGGKLKEVIAKKMKLTHGSSGTTKSELEKYIAEDREDPDAKIDILSWWKSNAQRFPILVHMARDVLAIPISTVASESVFSTSGRILDDFRTSLTPFMLEALVCTQDWLRRSTPIDIEENMEELAMIEKELIEEYGDAKEKEKAAKSQATPSTSKCASSKPGTTS